MSEANPLVLKIGGSVITDKEGDLAARTQIIDRLAEEIHRANARRLIIVHGGGSFGHPRAKQYAIKSGYKEETQKIGFSETHHVMTVLNGLLMDSLIWHEVPAVSITPLSCMTTENGRIKTIDDTPLKMTLNMGFVPVLYGDAVMDSKMGFTILSGDQIVSELAIRFNAERIIMGVDVNGLCDADPKIQKNARIFTHLSLAELKQLQSNLGKSIAHDVTGGMRGKMIELMPALEQGISVTILNATKPDYVYKALKKESVEGTLVEKG